VTRPTIIGRFRGSKREIPFGRILTPDEAERVTFRFNFLSGLLTDAIALHCDIL
jgi:hypothetical protein